MKISIVMPLYNAENFLKESIESIINQTFDDFELICVNDASEDSTVSIVKQFISIDSRIILLNNEKRSGAAFSRNRGIEVAKGDYLFFLDGDDIYDEEMLELACQKAIEEDADIVMFEYMHVPSDEIYNKRNVYHSSEYINRFCTKPYKFDIMLPCEFSMWSTSPCNKLFSRKMINDNNIRFQTLKNSNDVFFVEMAYFLAERIVQLGDTRVMVYARDHSTPTRISFDRDPMCTVSALLAIREELEKRSIWDKTRNYYWSVAFFHLLFAISKTKDENKASDFLNYLQQEGINRIINSNEREQLDKNSTIFKGYSDLLVCSFEERKQYDEYNFRLFLEGNKKRIIDLISRYRSKNQTIGIWGIGKHGIQFLAFCKDNNILIDYLIDADISKQSMEINNKNVILPTQIKDNIDLIIVTPIGIYNNVLDIIERNNIATEVIDLCSFLYMQ